MKILFSYILFGFFTPLFEAILGIIPLSLTALFGSSIIKIKKLFFFISIFITTLISFKLAFWITNSFLKIQPTFGMFLFASITHFLNGSYRMNRIPTPSNKQTEFFNLLAQLIGIWTSYFLWVS